MWKCSSHSELYACKNVLKPVLNDQNNKPQSSENFNAVSKVTGFFSSEPLCICIYICKHADYIIYRIHVT